ncbi:ATP-dependent helicase HepA [Nitrosomonas sp. Nm51]|uniref:RNA polymerase-associated protein RapA n=1 Tax=Nitrosomonas sp. Nm51 TaxID=133720 RepID=UPI0008B13D76|nr:RNA polymerase-associated protein RapA [Nitrosomonas sp. Nm51]SEQ90370.1 ATP-dependent helicase HepA [Nitrosomonas sp. Nm51]
MNNFKPGQRWICDADLQLGLGVVQSVEERAVSIAFLATGETRTYARQSAPLTRVTFGAGDTVASHEGIVIQVLSVQEKNDLFIYSGKDQTGNAVTLPEHLLAHHLQFNKPIDRLFNLHLDPDKWFRLRHQTWLQRNQLANSSLYGLLGGRTSLIPHQLYIAYEVGRRYAPRVLLADEVGLGKTIEAGMIMHQQHLAGRAERILIVVPETLTHQWLVEMLRRFNLHFSLFDQERFAALEESNISDNPFHSEQLVLCGVDFLCRDKKHVQAALKGDWDLVVVDEAHHLTWSETESSPAYQTIEQLAARTRGLLLLTATPEQLGKASHFVRLRLLDPDRFSDFHRFVIEEQQFEPVADVIEELLDGQKPSDDLRRIVLSTENTPQTQALLACLEKPETEPEICTQARHALANILLDRHGTGRILFRNTRATVKGFPARKLVVTPLPLPDYYDDCLKIFETTPLSEPQLLLYPELLYQAGADKNSPDWTEIDPRIDWLHQTMLQLKPEKILVITANAQTACDLAHALKMMTSRHIPVFHEQMSLLERDRAAAFFADTDAGSQVLICSEIGSEGRNFQFARHLVLFDLPFNPDLLEQRIGRLDRIGQTDTIKIHVPCLQNSAQTIMLNWLHQGLNALKKNCPAGLAVYQQFKHELILAMHQREPESIFFASLAERTRKASQMLSEALNRGRDRLLEYNSFRPQIAKQLYTVAVSRDADNNVQHYMDSAFDCFGIHTEAHRADCYRIEPGTHMTASFPGLPDEGLVITYNRNTALANEDMQFLTWEHPMVIHAMERVLDNETGNATVSGFSHRDARPGTLFLECLFVLDITAEISAAGYRNRMPSIMARTIIDEHGRSDYSTLDHDSINQNLSPISPHVARHVIDLKKEAVKEMAAASEKLVQIQIPHIIRQNREQLQTSIASEIERLKALREINPSIRDEEILFFEQQLKNITRALDAAHTRLDALRVIVAT